MATTTQWVRADDLHAMDLAEHLPENHPAHDLPDSVWEAATLEAPLGSRPELSYHDHYRLTVGPHVITLRHEEEGGGGWDGRGAVHYWHVEAEETR